MPWTHFKRPGTRARIEPVAGQTEQDRVAEELMTLRQWRDQLLRPISVAGAFNLLDNSHKLELARQLWTGDYLASLSGLREGNNILVEVLQSQISST